MTAVLSRSSAMRDAWPVIQVSQLPEGVWLAVSDDVPGLIVETATREEAIDLARELAFELMELDGRTPDRAAQKFTFVFPTA